MKIKLTLAALLIMGFAHQAIAAGNPSAGQAASAVCTACHGADGNSVVAMWPKLAGQHAGYLADQIRAFRDGERHEPTMSPMAAGLSDQQILDLAAYYAGQTQSSGSADPTLVGLGEKIYRGGNLDTGVAACAACHGPSGMGNPAAGFPRISGQHAQYAAKTLRDFRSGGRANDPASMMRDIAKRMSDEEIAAVASFMEGLK